jgi:hypothetical protein
VADKQAQDKQRVIWLAVAPFIALSLFAFAFIVHEERSRALPCCA